MHIARRGYLGGFGGDVCVLCKIDPEDVMVVPHNDPNKVRVKGYHILSVMSDEAMKLLRANKPMTGEEDALELVYRAIKGDHIDRIEQEVADAILADAQTTASPAPVKASPKPKAGTKEKKAKVSEPTHVPTTGKGTKAEQARTLYDAWQKSGKPADFAMLADFKKKAKKGWAAFGFYPEEIMKIEAAL